MKNNFLNFSATVKDAFENNENKYIGFFQLLKDSAKGIYEAGITKADADKQIRDTFRLIMGLDEKASAKEIRKAIRRNKNEIFEVIEDTVEDLLTSGWQDNEFFHDFVEVKNLGLDDTNEFMSEDKTVLTVGKLSGNHWDIDRQRLGIGDSFRVPTSWVGLAVYEEFERVMTGRADWGKLVTKIYEAMDEYVNALVFEAVMSAGTQVLPGSDQFYKTAALDAAAKSTFITMVEDVQAANRGAEVVIMGTKSALSRLSDLADVNWLSAEDKNDRRNMGRLGIWEGTRLVEIPQVFAKNDTSTKMVDPNVLLIMPVADNKFVKLVYEGDSQIKEVTDSTDKNDMTYEFKYLTKLGVATIVGRFFAVWNIVA
ncbi:MAG: hypothetical protein IJA10_10340 [Lachnospiraceae bacterium]|nr:hypothetical protein [Lachnospiraceae bacterium]